MMVAAKLDMKAAANPASRKPMTPVGTCSESTIGSNFSKSGVAIARISGMQNARARTVMPAIIR